MTTTINSTDYLNVSIAPLNPSNSVSNPYVYTTNTGASEWITVSSGITNPYKTLDITGDANITGDLTIKGKKILDVLENIEDRLAILHPNEELEEKWENLRGLRKAYMELEQEILEKEKIWKILKK